MKTFIYFFENYKYLVKKLCRYDKKNMLFWCQVSTDIKKLNLIVISASSSQRSREFIC